jgi:prefoldin beta subunit
LSEDANIYKLVGPVLLKQERAEAKMAVDARLEFIEGEM